MSNHWKAIITLIILCIGLSWYIISKELYHDTVVSNIQPLRDSIALIEKERFNLELKVDSLNKSYDSLLNIKQHVIIKYHEKIKFIYTADINQLDSIIQSSIK